MRSPTRFTLVPTLVFVFSLAWPAFALLTFPQSPAPQTAPKPRTSPPPEARIDVNHASTPDLLKVPGMTPTWANRIVRFRPYHTKQDLLDRGILPSDVYDRIKDYVIAHRDAH